MITVGLSPPVTDLRGLPMVTVLNLEVQLHIAFVHIWERLSGRSISLPGLQIVISQLGWLRCLSEAVG